MAYEKLNKTVMPDLIRHPEKEEKNRTSEFQLSALLRPE